MLITQHSTGRQNQAHFYQYANYCLQKVIFSKENPFFAFAACELNVSRLNSKDIVFM
jgi:hypothetical protein